jgi:L-fuconolactonase
MIIDSQIHIWTADRAPYCWESEFAEEHPDLYAHYSTREVHTELDTLEQIQYGAVDAALLHPPLLYGDDPSYCLRAAEARPAQFRVVARINPARPDVEDVLATWGRNALVVGVRFTAVREFEQARLSAGLLKTMLRAAARSDLPVSIYVPGAMAFLEEIVAAFPSTRFVIDHLNLRRAPGFDPWLDLGGLLGLSVFDNVVLKLTAVPAYSRQPYPFRDVWPHVHKIIDAFGADRVMWGSDITVHKSLDYRHGVDYVRQTAELSAGDKALILGDNLRRIFRWPALEVKHVL